MRGGGVAESKEAGCMLLWFGRAGAAADAGCEQGDEGAVPTEGMYHVAHPM